MSFKIMEKVRKGKVKKGGFDEGWLEAMGNLYDSFTQCVKAHKEGTFTEDMIDYPTVEAGIQGLKYVEACLESNEKGDIWVTL